MRITVSRSITSPHDEIRALVASGFAGVDPQGVEVHVKARGMRRTFVVLCDRRRCPLPLNHRALDGRGHHFQATAAQARVIAARHGRPLERRVRPRGRGFSGRAYNGVPGVARVAPDTLYLVTILMPASPRAATARRYPRVWRYARYAGAQPVRLASWQAELVHLAAHEARHVEQFRTGAATSELDAEAWAAAVLVGWTAGGG